MNLHENKNLFRQAVQATAQQMGILDIYVEKDYWVTLALHAIFENEIGEETVFKGGTALSKCFGIIKRFSEDIDLVVLRKEDETGSQLKRKLKKITTAVTSELEEVEIDGITNKMGMIRKVAYNYNKVFKGIYSQVRDVIIVEVTWLGRYEPYHTQAISSYIFEMMKTNDQLAIAEEYNMLPFEVQVLDVRRTICEKIMSLVRFSHTENAIENLNNKVRHTYDIHQLLKEKEIRGFFNSKDFDEMLLNVAHDDVESFKSGNEWLKIHPKDAILFSKPSETWGEIKKTYESSFKELVYGDFPDEKEILKTIQTIAERLQKVNWSITFQIELRGNLRKLN